MPNLIRQVGGLENSNATRMSVAGEHLASRSLIERVPSGVPNLKLENGFSKLNMVDIAQLVSASDCGSEGRGFESHYPPHKVPISS